PEDQRGGPVGLHRSLLAVIVQAMLRRKEHAPSQSRSTDLFADSACGTLSRSDGVAEYGRQSAASLLTEGGNMRRLVGTLATLTRHRWQHHEDDLLPTVQRGSTDREPSRPRSCPA